MRTWKQHLLELIISGLGLCGVTQAACLGDPSASKTYTFDVVPQLTAAKIYTTWSPLLQRVGQEASLCFELRVSATIPEFEQKLLKGEPEFVFLNPYHAVLAYQKKNTSRCWPIAKIC